MQDPTTRRYDAEQIWGDNYDRSWHERNIPEEKFARVLCKNCYICNCNGRHDEIQLVRCGNAEICPYCDDPRAHGKSIIIATDGACINNGYPNAIAGCGVFFGTDSIHNKSFQPVGSRATNQRAELHAPIYALTKIRNMYANGGSNDQGYIKEVIIKTDSDYVVNCMTCWIIKWHANGYINARGHPVVNQDLLKDLDWLCDRLDDLGLQVRFMWVP